jgi:L-fucose isomerase-like protein
MNENIFFNGSIGVIFGSRNIFNAGLVAGAKADLARLCGQLGVKTIFPQVTTTTNAAVETLDDARICARTLSSQREEIFGIVVVLANFGDEIGVAEAIRLSELRVPVLVQASDDDTDKVDVDSRRDAFCGKLSVCNNLKQYGIPFSLTTNHTENIDSALFRSDLEDFLGVCRVVGGLRHGRIAQFGVRPAGFQTVRFSEKLLQATGITVVPVDFASLLERARRLQREQKPVQDTIQQVRSYGNVPERITGQQLINVASFSLAIEQ